MLKIFSIFVILLAAARRSSGTEKFNGDQVIRVTSSPEEMKRLSEHVNFNLLDVWATRPSGMDVRIPAVHVEDVMDFLEENKISHQVMVEDVQQLIDEESHQRTTRSTTTQEVEELNRYLTYEETGEWINNIASKYPDLIQVEIFGKSYEGRNLTAVYVNYHEGNDVAVINCGFHAREWISPAICLATVNNLVKEAASNWTAIPRNISFVLIPINNPDGYVYSWTTGRLWRKTRSEHGSCVGVDPNRNFDINYAGSGASASMELCDLQIYCGPRPFSENCTEGLRDLVRNLTNVKFYVDVHSYGEMILYPYAYTDRQPEHSADLLESIARNASDSIFKSTYHRYEFGRTAELLYYTASGTSLDYFFEKMNITCSFAIESRGGQSFQDFLRYGSFGFFLPPRSIPGAVKDFWVALQTFTRAIAEGKCDP